MDLLKRFWRWEWNTETKYYDGEITRDTDWGGDASTDNQPVSGGRVQEWLKNEINGKFGVARMSQIDPDTNFYSIELFASQAEETAYDELDDKESDEAKKLVTKLTIPISAVQGDSYTARLYTSLPQNNIVVVDGKLVVPFRFSAVKYTQGEANNEGARGSLQIQQSNDNGSSWKDVTTLPSRLISRDMGDETFYEDDQVDLGAYLSQGKQMLRVRASFEYEDIVTGDKRTAFSSWVNVGASVTRTNLELELLTPFQTPMEAMNAETDEYNPFAVTYRALGAVKKDMHVIVEGSLASQEVVLSDITADGATQGISLGYSDKYGFHTHGVRKVTAWLQCEDGLGNTIKSEVLTNQFMMVADAGSTQKYLLLQNVKGSVTNYIQTQMAEYAVYAPDMSETELSFQVQDDKGNVYAEVTRKSEASKKEVLDMTMEIEPADEGSVPEGYITRFYVFSGSDNMILSSGLDEDGYYDLYVDNKNAVVPVLGATFLLNPKNRDNGESDRDKIFNAKANNAEVDADFVNFGFINDGWMTSQEDNQKVLRVMAGSTLTIHRNVWKRFLNYPDSTLTFEIDFRVSNVTNTEDPILQMKGGSGNKGLILNALKGWVRSSSYTNDDNCMFAWREGERQFLSVNIHNNVTPLGADCIYPANLESKAKGSIALARVLLNGDPVREIPFDITKSGEWCDDENAAIVIGNEGADIDIYSIRVYEGQQQIDWADLLMRNYPSSLPTTEEKQKFIEQNSIRSGRYISLKEAQAKGLNCIVYHGVRPYIHANASQKTGWVEYFRYDQNGNPMPEYSGKNCQASNALGWKPQGTTAQTYYEFNIQDDNSKLAYNFASRKNVIDVPLGDLHESITASNPYQGSIDEDDDKGGKYEGMVVDLYGGNLGKNFPLEMKGKPYPYSNGMVTVPDGWIDGNGKYRGMGYMVAPDTALAQKKVAKINYASAMQSHLLAACKSYDDLHYLCVGASPLQQQYIDKGLTRPVSAKHTEPFLMFWDNGSETYYTGLCVYGAGKMDKVAWGYVKKLHPMFAMVEGADNNKPLTDFRVPFDNEVEYDAGEEGWVYAGSQSFDFDAGITDDNGVPDESIRKQWAMYHNFVYLNSTNLKPFSGDVSQFLNSPEAASDLKSKYWCTTGDKAFHLLRYDFKNEEWVDAGLKDASGAYSVVDLRTDPRTRTTYEANKTSSNWDKINSAFKEDMAKFFKDNGKFFMSQKSLLFCYCYVLMFLAGTDNSSKNTYFKIDPIAQDMSGEASDAFSAWYLATFGESFDYTQCYLMFMDGDDMDSILPVNNKGNLTKPYYIERLYPYADGSTEYLYEGLDNALFNLVEAAFTHDERSAMMNTILTNMQNLVSEEDRVLALKGTKVSAWGFLHKYFFNVQYYFPKIAYLEQARIRYEFAEVMGHLGRDSVRPISQSIGSNVENEMQFMDQRLVYMASFAVFGALGNGTGAVGLDDATDRFSFTGSPLPATTEYPNGAPATFTFTLTPHQYLYPCGFNGTDTIPSKQRTSPKQTCTLTIAKNVTETTDTVMGIRGINYISDLGDLGDKSITTALIINGKRLTKLDAPQKSGNPFRPSFVTLDALNLKFIRISLREMIAQLDLTKQIRSNHVVIGGFLTNLILPKSNVLSTVQLSGWIYNTKMEYLPNLSIFTYDSDYAARMNSITIGNVGSIAKIQRLAEDVYANQRDLSSVRLQSIHVENVNWTDFDVEALSWFADRPTCEFKGTIAIKEDHPQGLPRVTWDLKNKILAKFGVVDDAKDTFHRGLLLDFQRKNFNPDASYIKGNFYVESGNKFKFEVRPSSIYENTQTSIGYYIESGIDATMNSETGELNVHSLKDTQTFGIIRAGIYYKNINLAVKRADVTKTIEIWNRPAQVGDLVYADGTFSSKESYDGEKTVVGRCFYVAPKKNGQVNTKFANPNDKWLRMMVSADDVYVNNSNAQQWGVFPLSSDESLIEPYSLYYLDDNDVKQNLSIDGVAIADIATIQNITSVGLTKQNEAGEWVSTNYIDDASYRDLTDEGYENDGFRVYAQNTAVGDGFGADTTGRVLDDLLARLAGSGYAKGDIVNSSYAKTLKVIQHRNGIISHVQESGEGINGLFPPLDFPAAASGRTELQHLGSLITAVREWAKGTGEGAPGETVNFNKWSQLLYPAASACYAYEPANLMDGEVLADKFKAHNWALPADGILARMFWYTYDGKGSDTAVTPKEDSPLDTVVNSNGKVVFKKITTSLLWSVTEVNSNYSWIVYFYNGATSYGSKYYSYVGRAVAAF